MNRRVTPFILTLAIAAAAMAALNAATGGGALSGSIIDRAQAPLAGLAVPLRNIDTGELVARAHTDRSGRFSFTNLKGGQYIVEVVGTSGNLVGTSAPVSVTANRDTALSVSTSTSYSNSSAAALLAAPPIGSEVVREAVQSGITGSSTLVNKWNHGGGGGGGRGMGRGHGRGSDSDSDTDKPPKSPKRPKDSDKDSDRDSDRDSHGRPHKHDFWCWHPHGHGRG